MEDAENRYWLHVSVATTEAAKKNKNDYYKVLDV